MARGEMGPMKFGPPNPDLEALGPVVVGSLETVPRLAAALGNFIAQMSGFEAMLATFATHVAGQTGPTIPVVFGRLLSVSSRIDIIDDLIVEREKDLGTEMTSKCREISAEARRINARRNVFVHGTYLVYPKVQAVTLIAWWLASGRANRAEWVKASDIREETMLVRKFIGRVTELLGVVGTPLTAEERELFGISG